MAELLCQIEHTGLKAIIDEGVGLRVEIKTLWPPATMCDYPVVEIWREGLNFGVPQSSLLEFAKDVARTLGRALPADELAFIARIFPGSVPYDWQASRDDVVPQEVVQQSPVNRRGIKLKCSRMRHYEYPSFGMAHPLGTGRVNVPLLVDGSDLVATVPEAMLRSLVNAIGEALES